MFGEKGAYVCCWADVGWYCFLGEGRDPWDHWDYFFFVLEVVYDFVFGEVLEAWDGYAEVFLVGVCGLVVGLLVCLGALRGWKDLRSL